MLAYTYEENGKFVLKEKEKPTLQSEDDAIVRVTLASIWFQRSPYQTRRRSESSSGDNGRS